MRNTETTIQLNEDLVCDKCGSEDVYQAIWAHLNDPIVPVVGRDMSDKVRSSLRKVSDTVGFCSCCDTECGLIETDEWRHEMTT